MFDLGSPPTSRWSVQLLTTEYLVSGTIDAARERVAFNLLGGDLRALRVYEPQIMPAGDLVVPQRAAVPWALVYGNQLVAVIPRDQDCLNFALKSTSAFKHPIAADVFAGPYVFSGTLMSPDQDLRVFEGYAAFVMQNVIIDCLVAGTKLPRVQAPYVMVVGNHKGFVVPR